MRRRQFIRASAATALCIPGMRWLGAGGPPEQSQDLVALTGEGKEVVLTARAIADLRASLRGRVMLAQNEGYEEARRILNPSFNKRPALIAQ